MAQLHQGKKHIIQGSRINVINTPLRCMQINLKHSRTATDNLMKLVEKEKPDIT
jgi:hypothetical protein